LAATTIRELLEAGAHFGAPAASWNPRMKPYIHGKRNKIHIIDLKHTVAGMTQAGHFLEELCATGRQVVYVCTKRHMRDVVLEQAQRAAMPRVTERWLGGTLTNFKTVRSRLTALEEMEETLADEALPKKAAASLGRKTRRIRKNLGGLATLNRIPGALLVVDPHREQIAVKEANRVGVPVVAILDTDCDPNGVDIRIPSNDDSLRVVSLLLARLTDRIVAGTGRFEASGKAPEDSVGVMQGGEFTAFERRSRAAPAGGRQAAEPAPSGAPAGEPDASAGTGGAEAAGEPAAPAKTAGAEAAAAPTGEPSPKTGGAEAASTSQPPASAPAGEAGTASTSEPSAPERTDDAASPPAGDASPGPASETSRSEPATSSGDAAPSTSDDDETSP